MNFMFRFWKIQLKYWKEDGSLFFLVFFLSLNIRVNKVWKNSKVWYFLLCEFKGEKFYNLVIFLLSATSQHRPAPLAWGKYHPAARGGPRPQLQGSLPPGRHQRRGSRRRRGKEWEHSRGLDGGEGVFGGKREEPPIGRGGRQQRGRSSTDDGAEARESGLPAPPQSFNHSLQGTT